MKKSYLMLLSRYLRPQWRRVALMSLLLLGGIAFQAGGPQVLRQFIDQVTGQAAPETLIGTAVIFLSVVFAGQAVSAFGSYTSAVVGWEATNRLRSDLALHALRLDMRFQHAHLPGEMIERIDRDPGILGNFFSQFAVQVAANSILVLVILGLIFSEDWRIGLVMIVYVAASFTLLLRVQHIHESVFSRSRAEQTQAVGFWEEMLTAREDIRPLGALGYILWRNRGHQRAMFPIGRLSVVLLRAYIVAFGAVFVVGNAVAFTMGAVLYSQGLTSIGGVYLLLYYTNLLATNLGSIANQANDFQQAVVALQRVSELTAVVSPLLDGPESFPSVLAPGLEFENVSFAYASETPVLRNLSFSLASGQTLGLIGRTGSGKSTIVRLIFRFYDPDQGAVRLDGVDLRKTCLSDLRAAVGMVTQEVQLFHASVRDNLTLFDERISDDKVLAVLDELGLLPWLLGLSEGLDTLLSGDAGLSAGEAQLISLARVFLQDPRLVILDEASAHLDPATEAVLERSIERLLRGRTAIVIAHRLSTLRRVDQVLVLAEGEQVEYGPRVFLAADPASTYSRLLKEGLGVQI